MPTNSNWLNVFDREPPENRNVLIWSDLYNRPRLAHYVAGHRHFCTCPERQGIDFIETDWWMLNISPTGEERN